MDVAGTSVRHSGNVYVWLGRGDGSFQNVSTYSIESVATNGIKTVAAGDLNRDGNLDLVMGTWQGVGVLLGIGDGSFRTGPAYPAPRLMPYALAGARSVVADVDGDGVPDVVNGFTVFLGNGDGSLRPPIIFGQWLDSLFGYLYGGYLAAADLNGDGRFDLIGPGGDGTVLSVLINNTPRRDDSVPAVSAANYTSPIAPRAIASVFGRALGA